MWKIPKAGASAEVLVRGCGRVKKGVWKAIGDGSSVFSTFHTLSPQRLHLLINALITLYCNALLSRLSPSLAWGFLEGRGHVFLLFVFSVQASLKDTAHSVPDDRNKASIVIK